MKFTVLLHAIMPFVFSASVKDFNQLTPAENLNLREHCGISGPSCHDSRRFKVMGGEKVCDGVYPWASVLRLDYSRDLEFRQDQGIQNSKFALWCGGSLISKRHLLTAAHCLHAGNDTIKGYGTRETLIWKHTSSSHTKELLTVMIGSTDIFTNDRRYSFIIKRVTVASGYPKISGGGDIALIELAHDIPPQLATPICLPTARNIVYNEHDPITAAGWGLDPESTEPATRFMKFINVEFQHDKYRRRRRTIKGQDPGGGGVPIDCIVTTEPFDRNVCKGDSGGPVMQHSSTTSRTTLIGITVSGTLCSEMHKRLHAGNRQSFKGALATDIR